MTETQKFTIGIVVAIVVPISLITIGLSLLSIIRKRRKREKEAVARNQDNIKDDSGDTQLYLQQKVELDDKQRRHEMEAIELRYEMEREDRIYELPAEDRRNRQELCGEERARELDKAKQ